MRKGRRADELGDCAVGCSGASMGALRPARSEHMRSAWFVLLAVLIAAAPARAGGPYPAVPPENGVAPFIGPTWDAYRCAEGTIYNFYHGAYYGEEPPALYRGYAYRPFYRYSAYRKWPRRYFCVTD
jgi:hypothetical protein